MKKLIVSSLAATTLAGSAYIAVAAPAGAANAAPLGLEIGVASCEQARQVLQPASEEKVGEDTLLTAAQPAQLMPGAQSVLVRCSGGAVIALQMKLPKGRMGNTSTREIYAGLKRKYKQVAGGAMPELGNGYARFAAGKTVIEQDAPHLSFEFTLTYYTKSFYDRIVEDNRRSQTNANNKKDAAL